MALSGSGLIIGGVGSGSGSFALCSPPRFQVTVLFAFVLLAGGGPGGGLGGGGSGPGQVSARIVLNAGNPDAKRLYDDLLSNYNKLVRPVVNTTDILPVRIKLKLSQLIDVVSLNLLLSKTYIEKKCPPSVWNFRLISEQFHSKI